MKGARKFYKYFKTGQYGRFYIVSGEHARGKTFRIQILPKDEIAIPNGCNNLCLNMDAVEVYGIISGNPGWSEEYGWKYLGKWVDDFYDLYRKRKSEIDEYKDMEEKKIIQFLEEEEQKKLKLLEQY